MTAFVRRQALSAALVVMLALVATSADASARPTSPVLRASPGLAAAIVADLNRLRQAHNLQPLAENPGLAAAARLHAREIAISGEFEHDSPDGTPFSKRVAKFYGSTGFRNWRVGENLLWASSGLTADLVVRSWLDSPPHRRIMLDPTFHDLGLAVVIENDAPGDFGGKDASIVTADFGARSH
jgi:uncharacterized protein YkwD